MKFGKKLRALLDQCDEEWRPKFINYKDLKKCINPTPANMTDFDVASKESDSDHDENESITNERQKLNTYSTINSTNLFQNNLQEVEKAETDLPNFFSSFRREVDKVNDFYLDKEEDYIIEHRQLSLRVEECVTLDHPSKQDFIRLRRRLSDFYGELVRLENFSTVNYTGFRKILKKHDKKTGHRIHDIYLRTVLITPFYIRDTVRKLISSTESLLLKLQSINKFRRETISCSHTAFTLSPTSANAIAQGQMNENEYNEEIQGDRWYVRPHAFISARSALWRLFRDTRIYGRSVRGWLSNRKKGTIPIPSDKLKDDMDSLMASELGLLDSFMNAITTNCNYSIASEQDFSIGFFILQAGKKLQLFAKQESRRCIITRNLYGKAELRYYQTVKEEDEELIVKQVGDGITVGAWPCVTCISGKKHVMWEAIERCAILYVWVPSSIDEYLPTFNIEKMEDGCVKVSKCGEEQQFKRFLC